MPLVDHITDRFGTNSQFLRQITNHDNRGAGTVNATRLAKAAAAAEGQFPKYIQDDYDDTDEAHIDAGVLGAIAYLRMWSSVQGKADSEFEKFHDSLERIAKTGKRKRMMPATSSHLTPSQPDQTQGEIRPDFDRQQDEDIQPESPHWTGGD